MGRQEGFLSAAISQMGPFGCQESFLSADFSFLTVSTRGLTARRERGKVAAP
jgi:hypothetical protein